MRTSVLIPLDCHKGPSMQLCPYDLPVNQAAVEHYLAVTPQWVPCERYW